MGAADAHRAGDHPSPARAGLRAVELLHGGGLGHRDIVEDTEGTEDGGRQEDPVEVDPIADERDEEGDLLVALERRERCGRGEQGGQDGGQRQRRERPSVASM